MIIIEVDGAFRIVARLNSSSWQLRSPRRVYAIAAIYEPYAVSFCFYDTRTYKVTRINEDDPKIQQIAEHFKIDIAELKAGTWENPNRKEGK